MLFHAKNFYEKTQLDNLKLQKKKVKSLLSIILSENDLMSLNDLQVSFQIFFNLSFFSFIDGSALALIRETIKGKLKGCQCKITFSCDFKNSSIIDKMAPRPLFN